MADAVPASNLFWIIDCWEMVRRKMKAEGAVEYILVIDEVQKIDSWSEAVKKEWDADTFNGLNIKVVLLGSSWRKTCRPKVSTFSRLRQLVLC